MMAKRAERAEKEGKKVEIPDIASVFETLSKQAIEAMIKRFKIVYYLLSKNRPLSDYTSQLELQDILETPNMKVPEELGKGIQYDSHRFPEEAAEIIAGWLWEVSLKQLHDSPTIGLMCDESTDVSNLKQLIVYLCGVCRGQPFVTLGTILDIPNGTAQTITDALLQFLDQSQIELNKVVALCSDGASVFTGAIDGNSCLRCQLSASCVCRCRGQIEASHRALTSIPLYRAQVEPVTERRLRGC